MELRLDCRTYLTNFFFHRGNRHGRRRRESYEQDGPRTHVGKLVGRGKNHRRGRVAQVGVFFFFFKTPKFIFFLPRTPLRVFLDWFFFFSPSIHKSVHKTPRRPLLAWEDFGVSVL